MSEIEDEGEWDWSWTRDALEDEMPMAQRLERMERVARTRHPAAPDALACARRIMNDMFAHRHCQHARCRRAKTCSSPKVECAFRKLPYLQRDIFPALVKYVRTMKPSGVEREWPL